MHRSDPKELDVRRGGQLLARALRRRCPHCGEGAIFSSWIRMQKECTACGFRFDRGEHDHFLGAYLVNLIVAEMLVVAGMVAVAMLTWPDVPWTALTWGLMLLVIPAPFITYPFARALWLAVDLQIQPSRPGDFEIGSPVG